MYIQSMKRALFVFLFLVVIGFAVNAGGSAENTKSILQSIPTLSPSKQSGVITSQTFFSGKDSNAEGYAVIERDMAQLERLYKYIQKNYLFEIDYNKIYQNMAEAMFDSLDDDYTYYVRPEDSKVYEEEAMGMYGGIGIYFLTNPVTEKDESENETKGFQVSQVFPNSPASKMGMIAKDLIIAVNGESCSDMTGNECASKMKGEVGDSVTLTIYRKGRVFDITLVRELIFTPTVEHQMIDSEVGYLSILEFTSDTADKVEQALAEMKNSGMKGLIIDLRNNPGGDISAALSIADMFISDADLLRIEYKNPDDKILYKASHNTIVSPDVKVVILVNEGSASSSEIFASTMQDNGRAVLVGSKTFGKGIIQLVTSFGEDAYISVTDAKYVPPSEREIHGNGLEPDYPVGSMILLDEEIDPYLELIESGKAEDFADKNPDFTNADVENFVSSNNSTGIRDEILRVVIRNAYYAKMENPPLVDIEYDMQAKTAYEILTGK